MKINILYVVMVIGLVVLIPIAKEWQKRPAEFFGIAENQDIDISINYDVRIVQYLVEEGDEVNEGQALVQVSIPDIELKKARLAQEKKAISADRDLLRSKQQRDRKKIEQDQKEATFEIDNKLSELRSSAEQNANLLSTLSTISDEVSLPKPSPEQVALEQEKASLATGYQARIENLNTTEAAELAALRIRMERIDLELEKLEVLTNEQLIRAPQSGIIGRIHYMDGEQVRRMEPLLNIYQRHPDRVTAYIPEGLLSGIREGDTLSVYSIQDSELQLWGRVESLGNKIRSLPVRMRKDPTIEAWGREVLLRIPATNQLMQGERVRIEEQQE